MCLFASPSSASALTEVTYVYTDQQGTPLAEANISGVVVSTYDYKPYGSLALGSPPSGPGYTGHVNDPDSAFVYMQARYYDPATGRFLSIDPVGVQFDGGGNFNRYWYANNNPMRYTDPDGRETVGELIDDRGEAAAGRHDQVGTYGWAFAATAWNYLGAESVSQVADKGVGAGASAMVFAAVDIGTLGKSSEAKAAASGVYRIVLSNGAEYIGKGQAARMLRSIQRILKESRAAGDVVEVTSATHIPIATEREALKEESRMIQAAGGPKSKNPDTKLLNKIDSSGTKFRIQDNEPGAGYDHR